jgi:CHASE2 domain-containing sensor protein/predicted Ser/Thr protein kinase
VKTTSGELKQNTELKTQSELQNSFRAKLSTVLFRIKRLSISALTSPALVASLAVTGLLLGGQQLNLLEPLELSAFDKLMRQRPALPPDPRLVIVEVTEKDIQSYGFPVSDGTLAQLLAKLQQYQPAVIGLDIYRDIEHPPGHAQLSKQLQKSDRLIVVCELKNSDNPGVPPPPKFPESRVGFSDIPIDKPNGIVRRALLSVGDASPSGCTTRMSLSFMVALTYLEKKGIQPSVTPQQEIKIGNTVFKKLLPNDGGYQHGDTAGYQILLNYRHPKTVAQKISLSDFLNNQIDPNLVKDRIVLIGATAVSAKDNFYTPFSFAGRRIEKMPGVVVHGQIVSQILSSVLEGRSSLFWFWPQWGESLWLLGWSVTGGVLVQVIRHPGKLILAEAAAVATLLGVSLVVFLQAGWLPVVAPTVGFITSAIAVLAYNIYERQKESEYIAGKVKEQEKNIALLQTLLKDTLTPLSATPENDTLLTETAIPTEDETAIAPSLNSGYPDTVKPPQTDPTLLGGHYKITSILGSGGFGRTYLAQDTHRPGTPLCVVKQLKPARSDERFLQIAKRLFFTEAEILEKLGNHSQIPRLLAYFVERNEFYLVQEYINGHPLSDELIVDKRLPESQVVKFVKEILEVLAFIHKHNVIHRDIKPGNIMRREADHQLFLIDFGAVKQIQPQDQSNEEGSTIAIGTRGYAPPEQYAGHPSFSSDIYALGMIAIQALIGIPPHRLELDKATGELSWRHLANVSDEFAKILEKMVYYHFATRYQSADEVLKELENIKL